VKASESRAEKRADKSRQKSRQESRQEQTKADKMEEAKTLWAGNVDQCSTEQTLYFFFQDYMSEITHVKLIRDKATYLPQGYGFVEFSSHAVAKLIFDNYNGKPIPAAPGKIYRLNWASHAMNPQATSAQQGSGEVHSVFVGDVPSEGTDQGMEALFKEYYGDHVTQARIVTDPQTGRPKGHGLLMRRLPRERSQR
jgi:RNA recognition motif-containing protein